MHFVHCKHFCDTHSHSETREPEWVTTLPEGVTNCAQRKDESERNGFGLLGFFL